jgi:hypothetical protein
MIRTTLPLIFVLMMLLAGFTQGQAASPAKPDRPFLALHLSVESDWQRGYRKSMMLGGIAE